MFGLTLYVCLVFLLAFTFGTDEHLYVRSHQGALASKFILKSEIVTNVIDCVLICEVNDNTLSVQYNRETGLCKCRSVLPFSLDVQEDANSSLYYSPAKVAFVPSKCMTSVGYIYDLEANFCFKVHLDKKTWVDAQAQCVSEGGLLAKVDTEKKRNIISNYVKEDGTIDYYVGGTDTGEDGVWRWVADDSIIPDMTKMGSKKCLEIDYGDLLFDDSGCDNASQRYVCEIGLGHA